MIKKLVYIIAAFWISIICGISFYNEYVLANGTEVLLKAGLKGSCCRVKNEYVILKYDISKLPDNLYKLYRHANYKHRKAYVILREDADKTYKIASVSAEKPENGIFISAEIYGKYLYYKNIVKYYPKEESAESFLANHTQDGYVRVLVGKNGNAKIKDVSAPLKH